MALIDRLFDRRAISPQTLFRTGVDTLDYGLGSAGVSVTADTALTYSGIWACVRLLASDISTLPLDAFRRVGDTRILLSPQPAWIKQPDVLDPSVTRIDHMAQVAISLLLDGNAFILATPSVIRPERLEVLNPRRVEVKKPNGIPEYHIQDAAGASADSLGPSDIVHVKINSKPGKLRGMSPIDANKGSIGISLAAQSWVERFFGQGAMMPGFIEVPVGANPTAVEEMRQDLQKRNGGWRKAGLLGFLTDGSKYNETGLTPQQADLGNIFRHQLEEGARIYGIPPFMVGSQEPAGVAYASSVERAQHYIDHCLIHYLAPIEAAYDRLVPGDQRLRERGSDTYLKFNLNGLLRGDPSARVAFYKGMFEVGGMSPDEIRAKEEMAPLPDGLGGDHYYPSANFTPLGQTPGTAIPQPEAPVP